MDDIYTLGVDVGSTATKAVVLRNGKEIVSTAVIGVGAGTSGPKRVMEEIFEGTDLSKEDMDFIMATGYGRNTFELADYQMSELTCHAKGAYFLFPGVKTIIDIGGQDSKALSIGDNGILDNFVMNDKCAAGTGKFLDVIAGRLEVDLDELEKLDDQAEDIVEISSTCTVFAESEVISQLSKGTDKPSIVKGIHNAIASRVGALAKRVGIKDDVVFTGGVALNHGMVRALEENIGHKIKTSEYSQLVGALGAGLLGYQKIANKRKREMALSANK
ncbi:acyl-CoA dehydratase activase [Anaerococcus urinomassiliensis]|uniref:acyl-CoA dehydratase activase n=1 Tax=Anaerococcus urinomassiliensis TaxID=1745712 RepID=UPI00093F5C71|nr:acyl-CoA dehydratase activase [Anaerococcus urinomassiliensis]